MDATPSTRWPLHGATAEQMDVQMRHGFSRVAPIVDDQPITAFRHAAAARNLRRGSQHSPEQRGILRSRCPDPRDAPARDDEHMHRGLRLNITERDEILRLVNEVGGNLASGDFLEDGHSRYQVREKVM